MGTTRSLRLAMALAILAPACDDGMRPLEEIPYVSITAGWLNHTCALSTEGAAYCWGGNNRAQLGGGPEVPLADHFRPIAVAGNHVFSAVTAGGTHTCALDGAGRAYCWGSHQDGQLGTGSATGPNTCRGAPCGALPAAVSGELEFQAISAGYDHTCALTSSGAVQCWGANQVGQLGNGRAGPDESSAEPVRVESSLLFTAVNAGARHSCALAEDEIVYCWGESLRAQVGSFADDTCHWADGTSVPCSTTPVPAADGMAFQAISSGQWHTCAGMTDRGTYCWGAGHSGQLGIEPDSVAPRCSVGNQSVRCSPDPVLVSGDLAFRFLGAGGSHNCGLVDDGEAFCWGANLLGQLGDGSFRALSALPRPVTGGHRFTQLSVGGGHSCAISGDEAAAFCWGRNDSGQLGTALGSAAYGPVRVEPPRQ